MAHDPNKSSETRVSPEDGAALDAVLDQAPAEGGISPERAKRIDEWLKILAAAPAPEPAGDLADRTLAAIQADRMRLQAKEAASMAPPVRVRGNWPRRLAEFGAMAVAASIFVSVIIVGLGQSQQSRARVACAENLQKFSTAFASYAAQNAKQLPGLETPSDHNWMSSMSPTVRTNTANLLPLVNTSLIDPKNVYCPGAEPGPAVKSAGSLNDIGYSYAYLYGATRPTWNGDHASIVLTDKNPMFIAGANTAAADKNSPNHKGHGNYLVRADGSVTWETSPNVGPSRDNIWTVSLRGQRVTNYKGVEAPESVNDIFVCP